MRAVIAVFVVEGDVCECIVLAKRAPHFEAATLVLRIGGRVDGSLLSLRNKDEASGMKYLRRTKQVPASQLPGVDAGKLSSGLIASGKFARKQVPPRRNLNHIDHTAKRITSIKTRRAAAQNFDGVYGFPWYMAPVNPSAKRIIQRNAVLEDQSAAG